MNFKLYNYNKKSLNRVVILGSGGIIASSLQKMLKERRINIMSIGRSKLDLKKFTTSKIIENLIEMFPTSHKRIKINNQIPNEQIYIDETKFIIALRNLLDNAFKYNKNNKDIEFNIEKNDDIEFQIKDFGIGISKENIQKIIEPFFQAIQTLSTKGFGLGLTICKKIVESHNGRLTIQSEEGKGSIFVLHLP